VKTGALQEKAGTAIKKLEKHMTRPDKDMNTTCKEAKKLATDRAEWRNPMHPSGCELNCLSYDKFRKTPQPVDKNNTLVSEVTLFFKFRANPSMRNLSANK